MAKRAYLTKPRKAAKRYNSDLNDHEWELIESDLAQLMVVVSAASVQDSEGSKRCCSGRSLTSRNIVDWFMSRLGLLSLMPVFPTYTMPNQKILVLWELPW